MFQFKSIDKETAYNLSKISRIIYSKFLLENKEGFCAKLKKDYPNKSLVKMMLLTNVLFCMNPESLDKIPSYSLADNNLNFANLQNDVNGILNNIVDLQIDFDKIKGLDIRNALFHGKFALGFSHDLNQSVLVLRPNTSKVNQKEKGTRKTYLDKLKERNQIRVFEDGDRPDLKAYNVIISETDLYDYIIQNYNFVLKEGGKGNSPLEFFALLSLSLYCEHENLNYNLNNEEIEWINSNALSIFQLASLFPLCFYCQDELDGLRKKYKTEQKTEPEELTNLFTIRDLITHGEMSQAYINDEYQLKLTDVYKGQIVEFFINKEFSEKTLSNFLEMFEDKNKIKEQ